MLDTAVEDMKSRIDQKDLDHLESFPGDQKASVLQKIMSRQPTERIVLDEDNGFERTLLKLRREGFNLIDLQRQETAFTCIWYRKTKSLFNGSGVDVAMLVWEMQDPIKVETTVLTWRL